MSIFWFFYNRQIYSYHTMTKILSIYTLPKTSALRGGHRIIQWHVSWVGCVSRQPFCYIVYCTIWVGVMIIILLLCSIIQYKYAFSMTCKANISLVKESQQCKLLVIGRPTHKQSPQQEDIHRQTDSDLRASYGIIS